LKDLNEMNWKEIIAKAWCFAQICAYIVGAIGGVLVAISSKYHFIAACVACVAAMAWPYVSAKVKQLEA